MFSFLDWSILATFSGAVGLTVIIVQMLKLPLDRVWKIPTRYLVYLVCLAVMLLAQVFIGKTLTLEIVCITAINAVLGALTAMSLYEQIIDLPEKKKLLAAYQYMASGTLGNTDNEDDSSQQADAVIATANEQDAPPDGGENDAVKTV